MTTDAQIAAAAKAIRNHARANIHLYNGTTTYWVDKAEELARVALTAAEEVEER